MAEPEDRTHLYMNDSEELDRWIEACFKDPQPSFYPKSLEPPAAVTVVDDVITPIEKESKHAVERVPKRNYRTTSVLDALQETQNFVANLLGGGVDNKTKKRMSTLKLVVAEEPKITSMKPSSARVCESRLMEVSKQYSYDQVAKKQKTDHRYTVAGEKRVAKSKVDNRSLRQKLSAAGTVKKYKCHDFHPLVY